MILMAIGLCSTFVITPLPQAQAKAQRSDLKVATVKYQPGDNTHDGYESASIDVQYMFRECLGSVGMNFRVQPDSLRVQIVYWYKGRRRTLPDNFPAPIVTRVTFAGQISGTHQKPFSYLASTSNGSCMDAGEVAKFSALWGPKTRDEQKRFILNGMQAVTAAAGYYAPSLRNLKAERYFDDLDKQEAKKR